MLAQACRPWIIRGDWILLIHILFTFAMYAKSKHTCAESVYPWVGGMKVKVGRWCFNSYWWISCLVPQYKGSFHNQGVSKSNFTLSSRRVLHCPSPYAPGTQHDKSNTCAQSLCSWICIFTEHAITRKFTVITFMNMDLWCKSWQHRGRITRSMTAKLPVPLVSLRWNAHVQNYTQDRTFSLYWTFHIVKYN